MLNRIKQQQHQLSWLDKALQQQHPGQKLQRNAQRLDELEQRFTQAMQHKLHDLQQQLAIRNHQLKQWQPDAAIARHQQQLGYYRQRLQRAMQLKLAKLHSQQAALSQTLHAISPLATLDRGYAIVQRQDNGRIVKSIRQLAVDDVLETRIAEGRVVSRVVEIAE